MLNSILYFKSILIDLLVVNDGENKEAFMHQCQNIKNLKQYFVTLLKRKL